MKNWFPQSDVTQQVFCINCKDLVWNEAARYGTLKDVSKQGGCVNEMNVFQGVFPHRAQCFQDKLRIH